MQSVKSLEKAYEYHKNEEKLLKEINTELKDYWNQADKSHQYVEDNQASTVSTKMTHKAQAKTETKEKAGAKAAVAAGGKSKPTDEQNAELEENVQLDEEDNFLQLQGEDENEDDGQDSADENLVQEEVEEGEDNLDENLVQEDLEESQDDLDENLLQEDDDQDETLLQEGEDQDENLVQEDEDQDDNLVQEESEEDMMPLTSRELLQESQEAENEWNRELHDYEKIQQEKSDLRLKSRMLLNQRHQ